jgi:protein ImuA
MASAAPVERPKMALGVAPLDAALSGGLEKAALHECAPASALHLGAATAFASGLARMAQHSQNSASGKRIVWIQQDFARAEGGAPYAPGCDAFGLASSELLVVRAARESDALWAMEESLKSSAVAAVIGEFSSPTEIDLTASRRLSLAAQQGGGLGLLLRHKPDPHPQAAATRWTISSAFATPESIGDAFGGLGPIAVSLSLTKNRRGPTGRWNLVWNHHEGHFAEAPLSVAVAAATADRPRRQNATGTNSQGASFEYIEQLAQRIRRFG